MASISSTLKGKYLGKFVEIGEGPNRVRGISDFNPVAGGLEILDVMGDQSEIIRLDKEGQQLEILSLDYLGTSFAPFARRSIRGFRELQSSHREK